jgi:divalent metal cation (Fe/Co/Zn/Cd) transporter
MPASSGANSVTVDRWIRRSLWLVSCTIVYNALEALVALWAGVGAGSIALVGFGLDSVIELAAGTVVLWRILIEVRGTDSQRVKRAESRVRRFVGATFLALAAYVLSQSAWGLWTGDAPEESVVGLVLAVASLIVMPLIAWGKLRAAEAIGSGALRAEAKETLACSYLSFCLLFGLAANAALGWWWADPLAALLMVPWLIREGLEGFEQDDD